MRIRRSQLTDAVTVHAGADHLTITPGQAVDLDRPIGAGTLAEALGPLVAAFVEDPVVEDVPGKKPGEPKRQPATSGGA